MSCVCGLSFQKQIEDTFPAQQGHFFHFALGHRSKRCGSIQDAGEHVLWQAFGAEQMGELAMTVELGVAVDAQ